MSTPFKAMSFKHHDVVTKDMVDTMSSNLQWVYENTPRSRFFTTSGNPDDTDIVIVSGRARIRPRKHRDYATVSVRLGSAFYPNTSPHVTTAIVSNRQVRTFCVVSGPKGVNYPNSNGFEIHVNVDSPSKKHDYIKGMFVHWHAFGRSRRGMRDF